MSGISYSDVYDELQDLKSPYLKGTEYWITGRPLKSDVLYIRDYGDDVGVEIYHSRFGGWMLEDSSDLKDLVSFIRKYKEEKCHTRSRSRESKEEVRVTKEAFDFNSTAIGLYDRLEGHLTNYGLILGKPKIDWDTRKTGKFKIQVNINNVKAVWVLELKDGKITDELSVGSKKFVLLSNGRFSRSQLNLLNKFFTSSENYRRM